jgi:hypothetical protein
MSQEEPNGGEVDQFILQEIDTVPQLEALLLLWNSRPRSWTLEELASSLYISAQATLAIVEPLERRGLVFSTESHYSYLSSHRDALIAAVDRTYRRELVRVSRMIHSNASAAVREFARAFRLKKDKD